MGKIRLQVGTCDHSTRPVLHALKPVTKHNSDYEARVGIVISIALTTVVAADGQRRWIQGTP